MDKEKGQCQCCGKKPRILETIDSGQKLCRKCMAELHPISPDDPATKSQLREAGWYGASFNGHPTRGEVDSLLCDLYSIEWYVRDAWMQRYNCRCIDDDVSTKQLRMVAKIFWSIPEAKARMLEEENAKMNSSGQINKLEEGAIFESVIETCQNFWKIRQEPKGLLHRLGLG